MSNFSYKLTFNDIKELDDAVNKVLDGMRSKMGENATPFIDPIKNLIYANAFYSSTELENKESKDLKELLKFAEHAILKEKSEDLGQPIISPSIHIIESIEGQKEIAKDDVPYGDPARLDLWYMIFMVKNKLIKLVSNGRNLRHALANVDATVLDTGGSEWSAANEEYKNNKSTLEEKAKQDPSKAVLPDQIQAKYKLPVANVIKNPSIEKIFNLWFASHVFKFVDRFVGNDGSLVDPTKKTATWTKLTSGKQVTVTEPKLVALITWAHALKMDKEGALTVDGSAFTDFFFASGTNFYRGFFFKGAKEVHQGKKRPRETKKEKDKSKKKTSVSGEEKNTPRIIGYGMSAEDINAYSKSRKALTSKPKEEATN